MHGVCGEEDVVEVVAHKYKNLFAHKYKNLFSSVSYTQNDMDSLLNDVDKGINDRCCTGLFYEEHDVIPEQIKHAMSRLNRGRNDGSSGLTTNHNTNSPEKLHAHLAFLFTSM